MSSFITLNNCNDSTSIRLTLKRETYFKLPHNVALNHSISNHIEFNTEKLLPLITSSS